MKVRTVTPIRILLLLAVTFIAVNGRSQVTADFEVDTTKGCAPLTISAMDLSSGVITSYAWDAGNGKSSTDSNPSFTYTDPGQYVLTLSINNGADQTSLSITVFSNPEVDLSTDTTKGCTGLKVKYTGTTINADAPVVSWEWDYGDSNGESTTDSLTSHTYTFQGIFDPSVFAVDSNGCKSNLKVIDDPISVSDKPKPSFPLTNLTACAPPLDIDLTASTSGMGPFTYAWEIGADFTSNDSSISHTLTEIGEHLISLRATDINGCTGVRTEKATIINPEADFTINDQVICLGDALDMDINSSAGTYSWYFDFENSTDIVISSNPNHVYADSGRYTIAHIVSQGVNCQDTAFGEVYVQQVIANYSLDSNYSCHALTSIGVNDSSTNASNYQWFVHDLSTSDSLIFSTSDNPTLDLITLNSLNAAYETWLWVASNEGCSDSIALDTVQVSRINLTATSMDTLGVAADAGCAPVTLDLSALASSGLDNSPIVSYAWSLPEGVIDSNQNVRVTYEDVGTYNNQVIATNELGCSEFLSITSFAGDSTVPSFDLDLGQNDTSCAFTPVQFVDSSNTPQYADNRVNEWSWINFGDGGNSQYGVFNQPFPIVHQYRDTGWMDVTLVTAYNGCTDTLIKEDVVYINGPVYGGLQVTSDCGLPNRRNFVASYLSANRIEWDFDSDGTIDSTFNDNDVNSELVDSVTWDFPTTGSYATQITGYNDSTGCSWTVSQNVNVYNISAQFEDIDGYEICLNDSLGVIVTDGDQATANWDYEGDGVIDTTYNTSNDTFYLKYSEPGRYRATLVSKDPIGCPDTTTKIVNVYNPRVGFTSDTAKGCIPFEVALNDTTSETLDTTYIRRTWSFGDGQIDTVSVPDITHLYDTLLPPEIDVQLISENIMGCIDTATLVIQVTSPDSTFTISDYTICQGTAINLSPSDTNGVDYQWIMGNNQDTLSGIAPTFSYSDSGSFVVKLTWTDTLGCTVSSSSSIVSVEQYLNPGFSDNRGDFQQLCSPWQAQFEDTTSGVVDRYWDLDKPSLNNIPDNPIPTSTYSNGTFTITLTTETANGCATSVSKTFVVEGPQAVLTIDPALICRGDEVTFTLSDTSDVGGMTWDFGDGQVDGVDQLTNSHIYENVPPSGFFPVDVILASADTSSTCNTTVRDSVFVYDARALILTDTNQACQPFTFTLENGSVNADSWTWYFSYDNRINSTDYTGLTETLEEPGDYQISLAIQQANAPSCTDSTTLDITVHPSPFTEVSQTCLGKDTVQLNIDDTTGTVSFTWSPGDWLSDSTIINPVATPGSSQNIKLSTVSNFNCADSAIIEVYLKPDLSALVTPDTSGLIIGQYIELAVEEDDRDLATTYEWSPENEWISCVNCNPTEVQPLETITYQVIATNECFVDTAEVTIGVLPELSLDVPLAFSPNGDGVNDTIYAAGWGIRKLIAFEIYNRWGEKVYENPGDVTQGWDGYYKGQLQNIETYSYVVIAEGYIQDDNGNYEQISKQGHISLLK